MLAGTDISIEHINHRLTAKEKRIIDKVIFRISDERDTDCGIEDTDPDPEIERVILKTAKKSIIMERFLNEQEVMNFLNIKKTTLRTLTLRKKVLTRYEIGNKYFYQTSEIMDYIEKCKARENDLKAFSEVQNIPSCPQGYARVITHQAFNLFQIINQLKFTWDCEKGMQILRLLASGKNYDTISKELYLSRERVRQLAERSIKKLRKKCLSMQDEYLNNHESVIEKNKQLVEEYANLRQYIDSLPEEQQKKIQKMISKEDVFAKSITDCDFDVRAYNTIASVGIKTLGELCRYSASELLRCRNLGKKSIVNIEEVMRDHGLVLGMLSKIKYD